MRRALLALALGLAATAAAAPAAHAAGCQTKLPVRVTLPSTFAAAYDRTIPVRVSTRGPAIRRARVDLYTFSGTRLGQGKARRTIGSSATIRVRMRFPVQPGSFTLVVTGEPNASRSCGPKQRSQVVKLRPCHDTLPLRFVDPPAGFAADYEDYLSVGLRATGPLITELEGSVYDAEGSLVGRGALEALYGTAKLDMKLASPLQPGDYTVVIDGFVDQPERCGPKTAQRTLTFQ